ncbi:hypothetical protein [Paenibacillus tundrae]|uniref:hypothetical protein n=1 Tax=Paenibacillus tundrae TaxID=528187 RepID=UPI0030CC3660
MNTPFDTLIRAYFNHGDDLYSGLLMAQEAGAIVMDFEGKPFEKSHPEPYLIACHPDHQTYLLNIVKEGLEI